MKGDAYTGAIKAFSNMKADDALKEAQAFVDGISTENKTALDTAKAAWEKEVLEKHQIRVAELVTAKQKRRVKHPNTQKRTQQE